jgi:hypothetical protein
VIDIGHQHEFESSFEMKDVLCYSSVLHVTASFDAMILPLY